MNDLLDPCKTCNKPTTISEVQLNSIIDIYQRQLGVYDCQRKAIKEAYRNGSTIDSLIPPPAMFRQVKGMLEAGGAYIITQAGKDSTSAVFPQDLRDKLSTMTSTKIEQVLLQYRDRIKTIQSILNRAMLMHSDRTRAFHTLRNDLSAVRKSAIEVRDPSSVAFTVTAAADP